MHLTLKLVEAVRVVTPHAASVALTPTLTTISEVAVTLAALSVMVKAVAAASGTQPAVSSARFAATTFVIAVPPEPTIGAVKVFPLKVSVPAKVAKVPVTEGNVRVASPASGMLKVNSLASRLARIYR